MNSTSPGSFPSTQWSMLSLAGESRPADPESRQRALEDLAQIYWRPVYAFLRLRWRLAPNDALDLTQEFFIKILDGTMLRAADPARGKFRAFLKACLDNFVKHEREKERAEKRGGGRVRLSIEWSENPDQFLIAQGGESPDEILDRHWRKAVLDKAVARLEERYRDEDKKIYFEIFRRYTQVPDDRERPTYETIANEMGSTPTHVDNCLRHARRTIRELIRDLLAASVCGPRELDEEIKEFFDPEES